MNLSNIISAGRMMSIVVALLGAFDCGATFALTDGFGLDTAFGAAFVVCGLALTVLFGRVARRTASQNSPNLSDSSNPSNPSNPSGSTDLSQNSRLSSLGTAILIVGTLALLLGAGGVAADRIDPFSWMMATVGFAIFVDALCLKISLSRR